MLNKYKSMTVGELAKEIEAQRLKAGWTKDCYGKWKAPANKLIFIDYTDILYSGKYTKIKKDN